MYLFSAAGRKKAIPIVRTAVCGAADFLQPDVVEKLQTIEQQLPEEGREDIKLKEIFRYYPIDGDLPGKSNSFTRCLWRIVAFRDLRCADALGKFQSLFRIRFLRTRAAAFGFKISERFYENRLL